MATRSEQPILKRKAEDLLIDPDTGAAIEDAKKPKIELDDAKKFKCISLIVEMYRTIIDMAFPISEPAKKGESMATDDESVILNNAALRNITVGNHIMSIIFTVHNICRQRANGKEDTNMIKKTSTTSFKVNFKGQEYPLTNDQVMSIWKEKVKSKGFVYKSFGPNDKENWYGTMGPYLDMFSSYALRVNELRLGHNNMPITKENGVHKSFPVPKVRIVRGTSCAIRRGIFSSRKKVVHRTEHRADDCLAMHDTQ